VKGTVLLAAAVLAAGATANAQDPAAPPATPSQTAAPAASRTRQAPSSVDAQEIRTMELVLTNAVQTGARNLGQQMQAREPGSMFVIDSARARGFVLEGYGVFFAVDVPMMRQSVVWSTRQLQMQETRNQIRELQRIAANSSDPETRRQAQAQVRVLAAALQLPYGSLGPASSDTVAQPQTNPQGQAVANAAPQPPGTVGAAVAPDSAVAPAVAALADPNELYTEAVKTALIDAMLKHSFSLHLGDEEWLTVAARDAEGPATAGQLGDVSTIILRIKGSDLTAYITNKLTREEVLKKVQVREF
jgi:hypothetical protein